MKLGLDRRTGLRRTITSWRSKSDPSPGGFSFGIDPRGEPQFFLWKGSQKLWRSGPWNGQRLSGVPEMNRNFIFNFRYVSDGDEVYFTYDLYNDSIASRMTLEDSGVLQRSTWLDGSRRWNAFWSVPVGQCDSYGECGAYGSCRVDHSPVCECLPGFEPKSERDWFLRDWSGGCRRRTELECGKTGEGFLKLGAVKVPDTWRSREEREISRTECVNECVKNCSCTAYTSLDINGGGSGCLMWDGELIDLQSYSDGGQDIYIRLSAKDLDSITKKKSKGFLGNKRNATLVILMLLLGALLPTLCGYGWWRRRKRSTHEVESHREIFSGAFEAEEGGKSPGLPSFDLPTIVAATKNFAVENKLGQGGFGPVYKGALINGQEIAVKRLSRNSGQGTEEFKNEVTLIAKLQHRNLVRILGFCVQGEEKMLIYEYMPNKSLDSLIFDQTQGMLLDWRRRFHIIMGIARGVLYLHQDSRLRIIHRDLKASNILLDEEMNPKISDFGMARIFGTDQIQANTLRVVGTYGYMSPEYAMDGLFSVKSDVFSFGVLLLEIISGKKNRNYCQDDPTVNLIGHVWELWKEGRVEELVDSSIATSCSMDEVVRCIQVGLLCVQESPTDRPSMSSVVFMLGNATTMSSPKQPAFLLRKNFSEKELSTSGTGSCSINEVTVSMLDAR